MAEALEVVAHLLLFGGKLVGVVEGLPAAASTGAEMGALGGGALVGIVADGNGAPFGIVLFLFEDLDVDDVAGNYEGDEDDHAVGPGNGFAFGSDVGDGDFFKYGLLFSLLHGDGGWMDGVGTRPGVKKRSTARQQYFFFSLQRVVCLDSGKLFLSLVGDGKFFSAFSAACSQNFSSVSRGHSLTKSVLIGSFSA